jgi:phage/conjugal plasmid C-4 type zinc finger TraR family protein
MFLSKQSLEKYMKGWGAQDDFQEQIAQTVADRMAVIQSQLSGPGKAICVDCDKPIPLARRQAYPSCTQCIDCKAESEGGYFIRRR